MSYVIKLSVPYIPTKLWSMNVVIRLQLTEFEIISVSTHGIRTNYDDNIFTTANHYYYFNLWPFTVVRDRAQNFEFVSTNVKLLFLSFGNLCFLFICSCST